MKGKYRGISGLNIFT